MLKPKWSFGLVSWFCADAVAVASEHRAIASSEQMNRFLRMGFPLREVKLSFECRGACYKACRRDVAMANTADKDGWLRCSAIAGISPSRPLRHCVIARTAP